jgi:hypothetical protein
MTGEPLADTSDRYTAHAMLRRETGLVRPVAAGDAERARVIAGTPTW